MLMGEFGKHKEALSPTILTIFGATGDLSADYLLPALFDLERAGFLPKDFRLVAVGRKPFDAKGYLDFIINKSGQKKKVSEALKKIFLKRLVYFQGDFDDPEKFKELAEVLKDQDGQNGHKCYNRLFYFATSPQLFASLARILKNQGLLMSCSSHERKTRVLVEKPFGFNFNSARSLNQLLLKYFSEEQIYRIDHFLGKETVQNLMVVRFANGLFEPLWNREFIDHVEISVLETDDVSKRVGYYDQTGALKDMVQNHILQMLALIAMDEPKDLSSKNIRDEKVKILSALDAGKSFKPSQHILKGQYEGYKKQAGAETATETFVALTAFVNLPRWQGVPFYLRTGKVLENKVTEISIHFKEISKCLFEGCSHNILTFRIQPDESVYLQINNKVPGFGVRLHQGNLEFGYKKAFKSEIPPAYERLLLDFMEGDQRLFIRSDEIESAWRYIDSIYAASKKSPVYLYKAGSKGPVEAEEFIKKDIRDWHTG